MCLNVKCTKASLTLIRSNSLLKPNKKVSQGKGKDAVLTRKKRSCYSKTFLNSSVGGVRG